MKINTITTGHNTRSQQIRLIYGSYNPIVEAAVRCTIPLSYIFIESVYKAHILEQSDLLPTLLQAGLSKLRTALTADSTEDLVMLMRFMGLSNNTQNLLNLLDQANNSTTNILDNPEWWDSLFDSANISDDNIRNTIRDQVTQIAKSPQLPAAKSQSDQNEQASTGSPPTGSYQHTMQSAKQSEQSSPSPQTNIQQHRQEEQQYNDYLSKQLEQVRAGRAANKAEIEKLLKAIEDKKSQAQTESVCNDIALKLLANQTVQNNIDTIGHLMARRLSVDLCIPYQHITEANIINRFSKAFRDLSNIAANPGLVGAHGVRSVGLKADNQRAKKLAVQLIANHLRGIFDQRLQAADMTPDDIIANYQKYITIDQKATEGGQLKPDEIQQYKDLAAKLQQVRQLFDRATPEAGATTDETPADQPAPENAAAPDSLEVAGPSGVEEQSQTPEQLEQQKQQWINSSPAQRGVTPASSKLNDQQKQDAIKLLAQMKQAVAQSVTTQLRGVADGSLSTLASEIFSEYQQNQQLDILANPTSYNQYLDDKLSQWLLSNRSTFYSRLGEIAKRVADQLAYNYSQIDNNVASAVHQYFCRSKVIVDQPDGGYINSAHEELAATRAYVLVTKLSDRLIPKYVAVVKSDILSRIKNEADRLKKQRSLISRLRGRNR